MAKQNVFKAMKGYAKSFPGLSGRAKPNAFPSHVLSGRITPRVKRLLSSKPFKFMKAITRFFSRISSRAYGTSVLSLGLVTLILYFLGLSYDMSAVTPIIGSVISILSVPFLLFDKPLSILFQDFAVTDYIFFEFFCIKRLNQMDTARHIPLIISFAFGVIVALAGYFVPVWVLMCGFVAFLFFCLTMISPEFAFFLSLMILPYAEYIPYSSVILVSMVSISALSFARKVVFGKRVMYLERYDLFIGIMMLFILISGIFIKGFSSFAWSLELVLLALGYTLSSNVIANRRLADRAILSIVISSFVPALISIVKFIITLAGSNTSTFADLVNSSVFKSSGVCAVFMMISIFYSSAMIIQSQGIRRFMFMLITLADIACLLISGELIALITLVLGTATFFTLKYPKISAWILIALPIVPYSIALLPETAIESLLLLVPSFNSSNELFDLWSSSISAFVDNIFFGIGIGNESFIEEIAKYGISHADNSANLFIEIGLEAGIFTLISFVILLFLRVFHRSSYHFYVNNSELNVLAPISTLCTLTLVAYGAFNYIWADPSSYYLFWCVFGIGSAALRVAKKENDDRMLYYEDTRAAYSSAIDINIL